MKIGVLSDTHIPGKASSLPDIVLETFSCADHIVHAGDIASLSVIRALERLAPVTAVAGNVDPPELRQMLGYKKTICLGGFTFGIVHGDGKSKTTARRAADSFYADATDCIIFGHSHIPYCGIFQDRLLFNPGSPTDKRANKYFSFGIIDINGSIAPHIVFFDSNGVFYS